jgi:hypothetical protein
MPDPENQRRGFGIVGLALTGFVLLGPGIFFINTNRLLLGWPLAIVGALPVLHDVFTMQSALFWRFVFTFLPAYVAYSLCFRMIE